ncbi:pyrroline-5-carboxylate reductase [Shewanella colwelliana]|uniref:Pyrroline-5-carboxylate reductase n=2 Tax=Shewanella colwelliana TaxID=23 RepID=A0ABQ4NYK2_SHECO|nr:pyrroline-5-carboxylate reductase [Shewanella colwelliana]MDX1282687.1 pyrroline-5-carboxylate reductase [Shewanella colwelliana]GIU40029.1 pyrroline-5-carboxylate reductase [Shewanella colwelliana]
MTMDNLHSNLDPQMPIAFIGGGNMAKAIIAGLIQHGHNSKSILVCTPSQATRSNLVEQFDIRVHQDNSAAVGFADVLLLAVKPFVIPQVCEEIAPIIATRPNKKLVISIAAGVKHQTLSKKLDNLQRIICAMPNLPSAIGKGLTGMYAPAHSQQQDIDMADSIMTAIGDTVWVKDEQQMSTIVATAGSSPAYFFLFLEAMEKAAIEQGLPKQAANKAVLQSAMGAISMAIDSQHDLPTLRRHVTSPKGTTEQAILAFQHGELDELVANAMHSAAKRAKELSLG